MKMGIGKTTIYVVFITVIIMVCTGCKKEETETISESDYKIYYIDNEETKVVYESYMPKFTDETITQDKILELLEQLKKKPKNLSYKKAKPDNISFKDFTLKEGQLTLNFDANYSNLKGIPEILCRAAIVKTLCQIEGVEYVEFTVNGQPLMNTNEKPIGFMKHEDFTDNSAGETNYRNAVMTLYFASESGDRLIETRITRNNYDGTTPMEQLIIEQLIKGPEVIEGAKEAGLYQTLPNNVELLKVTTKDSVCYVDLTSAFLNKLPEVTEEVAVYSIVNSLVELSAVNKVKFLIDGKEQEAFRENVKLGGFLERNLDIVENNQ